MQERRQGFQWRLRRILDDGIPVSSAFPSRGRLIGGGFAAIDEEVAAVLAFVLSRATYLTAQDDETGRCPKVVFKSPVTRDW